MRREMRLLVLTLLLAGCSSGSAPRAQPSDSPPPRARALFTSVCARCHGADGKGGPVPAAGPRPRDFTDRGFQKARSDVMIKDAIVKGRAAGAMPPFGATFTPEELDGLVQMVRAFGPKETR